VSLDTCVDGGCFLFFAVSVKQRRYSKFIKYLDNINCMEEENCVWLHDVGKEEHNEIGKKAGEIAGLCNAGFPVPSGFVITGHAFMRFLEENEIKNIVRNMLKNVDGENMKDSSEKIQAMILSAGMGGALRREILENYGNLNVNLDVFKMVNASTLNMIKSGRELPYVAVRGSLISDDCDGSLATFLNVRGGSNVIKAVQGCWASLYDYNAMLSRSEKNIPQTNVSAAVLIQKQVNAEKSGVIFTAHDNNMLIEAGFGYGEAVLLNQVNGDRYVVDKETFDVKNNVIGDKEFMYIRDETMERTKKMNLDDEKRRLNVLNLGEIKALARLGMDIERVYNSARDVEFAIENGKLYVIQTREYGGLKAAVFKDAGGEKPADVDDKDNGLFNMFDQPAENDDNKADEYIEIKPEVRESKKEEKKEQIYHIHKGSDNRYQTSATTNEPMDTSREEKEEKIIVNFSGGRIEMPKTKEGIRLMKQILELIEGQLN